jgi:myosin heavy subunit
VLIAVNPFQRVSIYGPEIIQAYSGRRRGDLEPHLFAIAEDAYSHMKQDLQGQTIIVSGERYVIPSYELIEEAHQHPRSGAGKTESVGDGSTLLKPKSDHFSHLGQTHHAIPRIC